MTKPIPIVLITFVFLGLSVVMDVIEHYTQYDAGILPDIFWKLAAMLGPFSVLIYSF